MTAFNTRRRIRPIWSACLALGACATAAIVVAQQPEPTTVAPISSAQNGLPYNALPPQPPFSQLDLPAVTHQVSEAVDRVQMIVNSSRILTQESRIPQAQVNNPEVVGLTALSPNQIQIYGRRPGVTQVNIWDEKGNIRTIDVMVHPDAQELARLLHDTFPKASLQIRPITNGIILTGYVDDPTQQSRIIEIAQNYYPNVINSITVGGVQQVLLQVRVMEVSRTKLRNLGVDMAAILENGSFAASGAAGILTTSALSAGNAIATSGRETIPFRIADSGDSFYGFVEALKQNNLAKVLADPNIVTESGRPAFMNAGGEFPVIVPQSLGTVSVEYRRFGTQIDFVPIVMGGGVIRLEVRPRISEIDDTRSVTLNGQQVPGLTVREADVAVTLRAGQTLAIAGLVQTRVNSSTRGIPVLMDTPLVGSMFRRTSDQLNEIELLIMVTPQLVDGISPEQLGALNGGPGSQTTNSDDLQLFAGGHIEVVPSAIRPPHFQREYLISPQGVEDMSLPLPAPPSGEATPAGEFAPAPQREPAARGAATVNPTPMPLPLRDSAPTTGGEPSIVRPPRGATGVVTPPATLDPGIELRGQSITSTPIPTTIRPSRVPAAPTQPSSAAQPEQPGLIGPIGYDVSK